jgi:hypothetical protein
MRRTNEDWESSPNKRGFKASAITVYIGMFIDQKSDLKSISIDLRLYQGPMVCPYGQKGYDKQKSGTKTVV